MALDGSQDTVSLSETVARWIEERRGIPAETAARCGVVTVNGNPAFEYRLNGKLQYRKIRVVRDGEKSFMRDRKGAETCAFLEHMIQEEPDLSKPLVVCEGEIDCLSFAAAGIPNVISVPDGAQLDAEGKGMVDPAEDKSFGWMWDANGLKPHFAQFSKIIIAADNDRKGKILAGELSVRFVRDNCDYVVYPEGCKDANEVLLKHGAEGIHALVNNTRPFIPDMLVPFGEIHDFGDGEIYNCGMTGLDTCPENGAGLGFAFNNYELVVITGVPGSGKSEFAVAMGANLARLHKLPGAILQFEDRPTRVHETLIRYAHNHLNRSLTRQEAKAWVDQWFRTIAPSQNMDVEHDFDWLKRVLRQARTRHNCRWAILDPWNEMDHMWERGQNETNYVNDALRLLKRLARSLQMILMVVVHPSITGGRIKDVDEQDLYMISGSAAWANKADHGIIVYRPKHDANDVYIKVAKSKDHTTMGKPGIVRMKYDVAQAKYRYEGMGIGA